MVSWFFKLCCRPIIITKQNEGQNSQRLYPKSQEELPNLNDFLCYLKSINILHFQSKVSNTRLLHTHPPNSPTAWSEQKPRGRLAIVFIKLKVQIHIPKRYLLENPDCSISWS